MSLKDGFLVLLIAFLLFVPPAFAGTVTYQYDGLNRLTRVQYSNGTAIEYAYDSAGNMLTKKVLLITPCTECSGDPVVLTTVTFASGTSCECTANTSITIGSGVTIKSGANITFRAPTVNILSGFNAENGSIVNIRQE